MLIDKLLLNVLIILMPNFICHVFFENRRLGGSPYLIGILHGISLSLCLLFAYKDYGLFWDLRYVPLVLASLQGGPIAGGITFLFYLSTRTYLGGDALWFGYLSGLLAFSVPLICSRKYWSFSQKKRMRLAVLVGLWPDFVMLVILVSYIVTQNLNLRNSSEILMNMLIFGSIQVLTVWFASILNEMFVERVFMKKELQRAEKLHTMGELAASMAHEIRNPLTVVKGFLQLMQKEEKEKEYQYLPLILSELGRAESIITDYLNFSKPRFEKIENINLSEFIAEVQFLLSSMAVKEGVELACILEDAFVHTDRNLLKQVLVNLTKNAIESTLEGGKVTIKLSKESDAIIITITDTGKGMTAEQISRIGTLFYTTRDKGTGLGTSVSLRIIEKMNGQISYKSNLGIGTEVKIMIPNS